MLSAEVATSGTKSAVRSSNSPAHSADNEAAAEPSKSAAQLTAMEPGSNELHISLTFSENCADIAVRSAAQELSAPASTAGSASSPRPDEPESKPNNCRMSGQTSAGFQPPYTGSNGPVGSFT